MSLIDAKEAFAVLKLIGSLVDQVNTQQGELVEAWERVRMLEREVLDLRSERQ